MKFGTGLTLFATWAAVHSDNVNVMSTQNKRICNVTNAISQVSQRTNNYVSPIGLDFLADFVQVMTITLLIIGAEVAHVQTNRLWQL